MDGALIATSHGGQITVRDVTVPDVADLIEDEPEREEVGYMSAQANEVDERRERLAAAGEAALRAIMEPAAEPEDESEPIEPPTIEDVRDLFK